MYCIYKSIIIIIIIIIICILLSRLILFCAYCYFNGKFYIHFGGPLEYWINDSMKEYPPSLEHGLQTFYLGRGRSKKKSCNH